MSLHVGWCPIVNTIGHPDLAEFRAAGGKLSDSVAVNHETRSHALSRSVVFRRHY